MLRRSYLGAGNRKPRWLGGAVGRGDAIWDNSKPDCLFYPLMLAYLRPALLVYRLRLIRLAYIGLSHHSSNNRPCDTKVSMCELSLPCSLC